MGRNNECNPERKGMEKRERTITLTELCAAVAHTKSVEECTTAIEAYKAIKDGTAQKEAEAKAQKRAEECTLAKVNAAMNRPIVDNFNAIQNALEETIDEYNETDALTEEGSSFSKTIGAYNISIKEVDAGFEITLNGISAVADSLNGRNIVALTKFFAQF